MITVQQKAKQDVDSLVNFSRIMGELSNEGKTELMDKIWLFIQTGDRSLLKDDLQ